MSCFLPIDSYCRYCICFSIVCLVSYVQCVVIIYIHIFKHMQYDYDMAMLQNCWTFKMTRPRLNMSNYSISHGYPDLGPLSTSISTILPGGDGQGLARPILTQECLYFTLVKCFSSPKCDIHCSEDGILEESWFSLTIVTPKA